MIVRTLRNDEGKLLGELFVGMTAETPTAFAGTLAELEARSAEEWQTLAAHIAASPSMEAFVAEDGEDVCGFVTGAILTKQRLAAFEGRQDESESSELSDTAMLGRMWVAPQMRGKGVAQELIQTVIAWSREKQQRRVLLAVTDGNERARRCYVAADFVPTGFSMPHPSYPEVNIHFMDYAL